MATMYNPPHLGELIRESIEAEGWSVTETARRLGMGRVALSACRQRWRWRWNGSAGATRNTGCGCKQSTMWRKSDAEDARALGKGRRAAGQPRG